MKMAKNIIILIVGLVLVSVVYNFSAARQRARVPVMPNANEETPLGEQPTNDETVNSFGVTVKIDQGASAQGVKIIPTAVLEDSRCPMNARCIWAGQLRLQAIVMAGSTVKTEEFILGEQKNIFEKTITFADARPDTEAGSQIQESRYEFDFEIK